MGAAIDGVVIRPLPRFPDDRGMVMRILGAGEAEFAGFGEVYASSVYPGAVKGWHRHEDSSRNYVVLKGMIKLVLYDDRPESASRGQLQEVFMGEHNYVRVTIPARVWSGFACVGSREALVVDVLERPHDPAAVRRADLQGGEIPYSWAAGGRK
jgi:dTDP-4-dehydrorhamnose 3,5-epimerase